MDYQGNNRRHNYQCNEYFQCNGQAFTHYEGEYSEECVGGYYKQHINYHMKQISKPVGMVENEYQVNNDGSQEKIVHYP